jgi:hypothetical protein
VKDSTADEGFEKALSANLARVLDLLKFAEAKNAALLAFASAWILGLVNLLSSGKALPCGYTTAGLLALPLFVAAALISIASLLPKLDTGTFTGEPKGHTPNLLFFGDIADQTVEGFKIDVRARHRPTDGHAVAIGHLDDLEVQIAINSKIARRKYRLFNWGALVALVAIAGFGVPSAGVAFPAAAAWACPV